MAKKYTKTYDINYSDVDSKLRCRISSIINFICDIGTNQSEVLGDTIESLKKKNIAWVFYKYDIKIYKYPMYREKISITTEPFGFRKFYAYRNYVIKNEKGEVLGETMAIFFLIDIEKRRAIRIPKDEYELYDIGGNLKEDIKMDQVRVSDVEENIKEYEVRYRDIDSNGHVNNVNYVEWAIESVPLNVAKNFTIGRVKVVFERETKYGESIRVSCSTIEEEESKLITSHIIKNSEGVEVTKLELEWKKE